MSPATPAAEPRRVPARLADLQDAATGNASRLAEEAEPWRMQTAPPSPPRPPALARWRPRPASATRPRQRGRRRSTHDATGANGCHVRRLVPSRRGRRHRNARLRRVAAVQGSRHRPRRSASNAGSAGAARRHRAGHRRGRPPGGTRSADEPASRARRARLDATARHASHPAPGRAIWNWPQPDSALRGWTATIGHRADSLSQVADGPGGEAEPQTSFRGDVLDNPGQVIEVAAGVTQ